MLPNEAATQGQIDEYCNSKTEKADDDCLDYTKTFADSGDGDCQNTTAYNDNSIFKQLEQDGIYDKIEKTDKQSDFTKLSAKNKYCDNKNSETMETPTPTPLDGGWGWMVVFACFLHFVIEAGLLTSYGVLYVEIMDYLKVDKVAISWIGAIRGGLYLGVAPFVLPFTKKFSCREVTISGSIIVFGSMIVSAYVITLPSLIVCMGVLQGIGFGLIHATSLFIVNQYFDKKRPIALGLAVSGAAAGQVIYPVLQEFLLKNYGLSLTLFLNAGLSLNLIVCGAMYFPLQSKKTSQKGIALKKITTCTYEKSTNISIFRNQLFVSFVCNNVLIATGGFVPLYFLPDLAVRSGFDLNKAAVLISILGISSGFGRVMIGSCGFRIPKFRPDFFIILTILSGVLVAIIPFCINNYGQLAVLVAGFGFTMGGLICLCYVLIVDLFKREYLASSLGYATLAQGIGSFIGSPIAAGIAEVVGSDDVMFYFTGILFVLASILLKISLICNNSTKNVPKIEKDPEKTPLL